MTMLVIVESLSDMDDALRDILDIFRRHSRIVIELGDEHVYSDIDHGWVQLYETVLRHGLKCVTECNSVSIKVFKIVKDGKDICRITIMLAKP